MSPNRLHCGNIAAHTALLVILPRESTWGGTGRLIPGYNSLSWENGQGWYRPAGTGRCRTVRKYPSRTFFAGDVRYCLGRPGWRDDQRHGLAIAHGTDPMPYASFVSYVYFAGTPLGVLRPDDPVVREIEDALRIAE